MCRNGPSIRGKVCPPEIMEGAFLQPEKHVRNAAGSASSELRHVNYNFASTSLPSLLCRRGVFRVSHSLGVDTWLLAE